RKDQKAREAERARDESTAAQLLASLSENAALKAGLQILLANPGNADARRTLEDQLGEMASSLQFDLLSVSANGRAEVSVLFDGHRVRAVQFPETKGARSGFLAAEDHLYQLASGPVNQGEEYLGDLTIGQRFDLSRFDTPVVLIHN